MQSLVSYRHLHEWVKEKTADFQRVSGEALASPPLSNLPPLSACLEERFQESPVLPRSGNSKEWMRTFGIELSRIELDSEEEADRVRCLADRLAKSTWIEASPLEIIPYIDGTPAGTSRNADVVWVDHSLYVERLPKARLARRVPEEIQKAFVRPDIKAALDYAFERPTQDVKEYLQENFVLAAAATPTERRALPIDNECEPDAIPIAASDPVSEQEDELLVEVSGDTDPMAPVPLNVTSEPNIDDGDDRFPDSGSEIPSTPTRARQKPAKPNIMERFAASVGFRQDGEARFFHADGSWIGKVNGSVFPWEHRTAGGDLVRCYWPKDHCLERDPLKLDADVWGLIEKHPETYSFVLFDLEGNPVELSGARLREMSTAGTVTLFPASYRLVFKQ